MVGAPKRYLKAVRVVVNSLKMNLGKTEARGRLRPGWQLLTYSEWGIPLSNVAGLQFVSSSGFALASDAHKPFVV